MYRGSFRNFGKVNVLFFVVFFDKSFSLQYWMNENEKTSIYSNLPPTYDAFD